MDREDRGIGGFHLPRGFWRWKPVRFARFLTPERVERGVGHTPVVDFLLDFALPSTDAAAITQAVVFGLIVAGALWFVRRRPEPRVFVIGIGLLGFSLIALRAVH